VLIYIRALVTCLVNSHWSTFSLEHMLDSCSELYLQQNPHLGTRSIAEALAVLPNTAASPASAARASTARPLSHALSALLSARKQPPHHQCHVTASDVSARCFTPPVANTDSFYIAAFALLMLSVDRHGAGPSVGAAAANRFGWARMDEDQFVRHVKQAIGGTWPIGFAAVCM